VRGKQLPAFGLAQQLRQLGDRCSCEHRAGIDEIEDNRVREALISIKKSGYVDLG
jgi:hypothetical protein